jgi:hypothetical protein
MLKHTTFHAAFMPASSDGLLLSTPRPGSSKLMLKADTFFGAPAPSDEPSRMSVDRPGNEEESIARAAVVRADALLAERDASIPKNFAGQLFGRAVPEDIARYDR